MSAPRIAVTAANGRTQAGFATLTVNHNYLTAVAQGGGIPWIAADVLDTEYIVRHADGLLLTGGADVEPERYGEQQQAENLHCDPRRDQQEFVLAERFIQAGKPILAICRGFQVLNVLLGGTLVQDVPAWCGAEHGGGVMHCVDLAPHSILSDLLGERIMVNSYHHQAVTPERLAPVLLPTALWHGDAAVLVEGFQHKTLPILGVQWHPERMLGETEEGSASRCTPMLILFRWLAENAKASS